MNLSAYSNTSKYAKKVFSDIIYLAMNTAPNNEPERSVESEEIRLGVHNIDPTRDMSISAKDSEGRAVSLSDFRTENNGEGDENILARVGYTTKDGEFQAEEVRMSKRVVAAGKTTMEVVQRNKGKIAVVGSVVVAIAAGTGLLIRRNHRSGD